MATKASFDIKTLPWILSNALNNLQAKQNIIIMNDFIDGATTYTAYQLSAKRFGTTIATDVASTRVPATAVVEKIHIGVGNPGKISEEEAEAAKAKAVAVLAHHRTREALLRMIAKSNRKTLDAKEILSEEEKSNQAVLKASWKEAEDVKKKQGQAVDMAEKRLEAVKTGKQQGSS